MFIYCVRNKLTSMLQTVRKSITRLNISQQHNHQYFEVYCSSSLHHAIVADTKTITFSKRRNTQTLIQSTKITKSYTICSETILKMTLIGRLEASVSVFKKMELSHNFVATEKKTKFKYVFTNSLWKRQPYTPYVFLKEDLVEVS